MVDIKTTRLKAESLKGNFPKDPEDREVIFIEHNVGERTPVLIGLSGFFGTSRSFMNRSFGHRDFLNVVENMSKAGKVQSFVIALPDTMTSYYGNQYVDSIAVGSYERFIASDLVKLITERYGRRRIGLFGKSSGGFGAYNLSVRNPSVFDGFIDVSGDSGFEYCYMRDFPQTISMVSKYGLDGFISHFRKKPNPNQNEMAAMNIVAMSAFYSPDEHAELKFRLPFDEASFRPNPEVWEKWLELDPLNNIEHHIDHLRGKKIILQVGSRDEFAIHIGIRGLSRILKKNSVEHEFTEYEDEGHFGIEYFYEHSMPELIRYLAD